MAGARSGGVGWRRSATVGALAAVGAFAALTLGGCSGGSGGAVGAGVPADRTTSTPAATSATSASGTRATVTVTRTPTRGSSPAVATAGHGTPAPPGRTAFPAGLQSSDNPVLLLRVASGSPRTVVARPAVLVRSTDAEGSDLKVTGPARTYPVAADARVFLCGPLWDLPLPKSQEVEEYTWAAFTTLLGRHGVGDGMAFYLDLGAHGRIVLLHQHYHP